MLRNLDIRRAEPIDAKLISELSALTFNQTYKGTCSDEDMINFISKCFNEEGVFNELANPEEFYFIAFVGEVAVGYMRLKEDYSDYPEMTKYFALELKRIYILNEYQGQRIGAALMNHAVEFALSKKFEVLWLGVWEENHRAFKFYESCGFKDTGARYTFYIGETAQTDHWMMKVL